MAAWDYKPGGQKELKKMREQELIPTKASLLKQDLVLMAHHHKDVLTNSLKIADTFEREHKNVLQRIRYLIKKDRLTCQPISYLDESNRKQTFYELDQEQFSLVALGMKGEKAEDFRVAFVGEFKRVVTELEQWRSGRKAVKQPTLETCDEIKWLVDNLTGRRAKFGYSSIQGNINRCAVNGRIKSREDMTTLELLRIEQLEKRVQASIKSYRGKGFTPREIYDHLLYFTIQRDLDLTKPLKVLGDDHEDDEAGQAEFEKELEAAKAKHIFT